jgi:hypothetical protein
MNVQRAAGKFDFFTSPVEREEWFRMLDEFYNRTPEADKANSTDAEDGVAK